MSDNRLGIQSFPNDQVREYHVNGCVSNTRVFEITRDAMSKYPVKSTYGVEIDSETLQLVDTLFQNRAIATIGLDETTVRITLRKMFYWHETQDDILDAILNRLGWVKNETDITSISDFRKMASYVDPDTIPVDRLN